MPATARATARRCRQFIGQVVGPSDKLSDDRPGTHARLCGRDRRATTIRVARRLLTAGKSSVGTRRIDGLTATHCSCFLHWPDRCRHSKTTPLAARAGADRLRQAGRRPVLRVRGLRLEGGRMGARRRAGQSRPPPPDPSNEYLGDSAAELLGQAFFFDTAFSGAANRDGRDQPRRRRPRARRNASRWRSRARPATTSRAPASTRRRSPGTYRSAPGGPTSTRSPMVNSAYRPVVFWNGRARLAVGAQRRRRREPDDDERQPAAHGAPHRRQLRAALR